MTEFSYHLTKDRRVLIAWQGRQVVALKGPRAEKFISEKEALGADELQLLLARVTGNFKHGNERRDPEK